MTSVLESRPPRFTAKQAAKIAADVFGIHGSASDLGSERDQAFLIDDDGRDGVLKISNSGEDPAALDLEESAIAHVVFRDGRPAEVKLTPVVLGYGYRAVDGGWPEIADVGEATQILEHLQKLSEPYGTKIAISNGVGTITLPK